MTTFMPISSRPRAACRVEVKPGIGGERSQLSWVRSFQSPPWTPQGDSAADDFPYIPLKGAGRYAPGNVSYVAYAGQYEALKRILALGVNNIYAYTKPMCDRLKMELPALGCQLITPMDAVRSIVVVQAKNLKTTEEKLRKAHVQVTTTGDNRVRISPALYNNMEDINRLLSALRDAPIA